MVTLTDIEFDNLISMEPEPTAVNMVVNSAATRREIYGAAYAMALADVCRKIMGE